MDKTKKLISSTAILVALAGGANAQSAPMFNGFAQLEGLYVSGSTNSVGFADFDGAFSFSGGGSALSFGIEYDVIALHATGLGLVGAYYLSDFADFGNGRVNVGAVKSAYSQFERETILGTNGYLAYALYAPCIVLGSGLYPVGRIGESLAWPAL